MDSQSNNEVIPKVEYCNEYYCQMISAAASSVLRFSTNVQFRSRCFNLVGVDSTALAGEQLEKRLLASITCKVTLPGDSQVSNIGYHSQDFASMNQDSEMDKAENKFASDPSTEDYVQTQTNKSRPTDIAAYTLRMFSIPDGRLDDSNILLIIRRSAVG
ncbi:unnamed protein product [Timema podura]|uniref:Uncharacterized protein n=1 Tax=Timema podura TaxID=61482 RepID=A0ABN7NUM1_TIMPD|nr:unnamed protein product [Timema podura]